MRYLALACDYDGTVAEGGRLDPGTRAALERLKASGRSLILVTGRRLDDLRRICPQIATFDRVVAENGALLHRPATRETRVLGAPPPGRLVALLRERGASPLAAGEVIVATEEPHGALVRDVIRELGLDLRVILNKGAVMVLPPGIDKASGLRAALEDLGLAPQSVVGVGDAENDHAFLAVCGRAVAVADALPALKEACDEVSPSPGPRGVRELVGRLLESDR